MVVLIGSASRRGSGLRGGGVDECRVRPRPRYPPAGQVSECAPSTATPCILVGIEPWAWVVNNGLAAAHPTSDVLRRRSAPSATRSTSRGHTAGARSFRCCQPSPSDQELSPRSPQPRSRLPREVAVPDSRSLPVGFLPVADRCAGPCRARPGGRGAGGADPHHPDSDGTYGAPHITAELREAGIEVNHKRVEWVMREHGIVGVHLRKPVCAPPSPIRMRPWCRT
jgi:hypothetical protein